MKVSATGNVHRRRRTWYRRRLRIRRALTFSALVVIIAAACWQNASRILSAASRASSQRASESFWTQANLRQELAWTPPHVAKRAKYVDRIPGVYPYSVVPGGLRDVDALREAVARDRAVSRHYSQFDYSKAHLVRLTEPREVYVSYRIRDTVFWTRKKIQLKIGELLLTDGKITARAKCGNQVSDTAKPEVSNEEPEEDVLDRAVAVDPIGPSLPIRPVLSAANLPIGQPIGPTLSANGFIFPYVPFGGGPPVVCSTKDGGIDKRCRPHKRPVAPEPATWLLIASGVAAIVWRYRATSTSRSRALVV